jgi:hypothetical protein
MDKKEQSNPWQVLALLWGIVLFFTVYGAVEVKDELKQEWLDPIMGGMAQAGDATGLTHVKSGVQAIRGRVNKDYVVLATETVETVPPVSAEPEQKGSHRVAPAKHRVLVVGASSIQFALGVELEQVLPAIYDGVKTKRFGKLATGLSRPDFFDWPKKLDQLAKQFKPDLVIANYGGNCAQDIPTEGGEVKYENEKAWDPLYADRVAELVRISKKHGADFVFIGMPNMRDPKFAKKMERLNRVQKKGAEDAGALWISVWDMTSDAKGGYKTELEFRGERGLMRAIDGVHYRTLGARYIVEQAMQEVERHFVLAPTDPALARSERHSFDTKEHGSLSYVAFVPKNAGEQNKLPVLYVVPSAGAKWDEWPNYPHRDLQRLAAKHQVVLVVVDRADLLETEIAPDVAGHLPVRDRSEVVKDVDKRNVLERVRDAAEQLSAPVTRR